MIDPTVLLVFLPAALALNLMPGADMMFCAAQAMSQGQRAAWRASAGIALGGMLHGLAAGLGLAAIMAAQPLLFDVIRWVGVAYLLWLAWNALIADPAAPSDARRAPRPFAEGLIVNLTNPKVILFVLAFMPQFIDPTQAILPQFLIFSALLVTGGFVINGLAGTLAGGVRQVIKGRAARWPARISAVVFAALALRLILQERP
ncbi:MAG: LysE family translocator [Pseudomonadota bacterium]